MANTYTQELPNITMPTDSGVPFIEHIDLASLQRAYLFANSEARSLEQTQGRGSLFGLSKIGTPAYLGNQWGPVMDKQNCYVMDLNETPTFTMATLMRMEPTQATLNGIAYGVSSYNDNTAGGETGSFIGVQGLTTTTPDRVQTFIGTTQKNGSNVSSDLQRFVDVVNQDPINTDIVRYRLTFQIVDATANVQRNWHSAGFDWVNGAVTFDTQTPSGGNSVATRNLGGVWHIGAPSQADVTAHTIKSQVVYVGLWNAPLTATQVRDQARLIRTGVGFGGITL